MLRRWVKMELSHFVMPVMVFCIVKCDLAETNIRLECIPIVDSIHLHLWVELKGNSSTRWVGQLLQETAVYINGRLSSAMLTQRARPICTMIWVVVTALCYRREHNSHEKEVKVVIHLRKNVFYCFDLILSKRERKLTDRFITQNSFTADLSLCIKLDTSSPLLRLIFFHWHFFGEIPGIIPPWHLFVLTSVFAS